MKAAASTLPAARRFLASAAAAARAAPTPLYTRAGEQPPAAPAAARTASRAAAGVAVATVDDLGPASSLAVVVAAGSRFDSPLAQGAAHLLKSALVRRIPGDNVARLVRETELRGNSLYSTVTREHLVLASDFLRDDLVDVVPTLLSQLLNRSFESYEFLDAIPPTIEQTKNSLADPSTLVLEKIHELVFRSGLGNPLFASEAALESLTRADLLAHAERYMTPDRITIVGSGVSHADLVPLVDATLARFSLSNAKTENTKSTYHSGEIRIDAGPHSVAHYAVAFPGVSYTAPEFHASVVLQSLLGGTQRIKWGSRGGLTGLLADVATENTMAQAFAIPYSDAGLFGIYTTGKADELSSVVPKALDALKSVASGVSEEALVGAKKAAMIDTESQLTRQGLVESIAKGALMSASFRPTADILAINKVTAEDVKTLAKKILANKPSIVAHGNTREMPYADQL